MNKIYAFISIIFLLLISVVDTHASHAAGGELIYELVPNTTNQYKFTFKFYRDCSGVSEPNTFTMCYSNSCGVTNQSVVLSKIVGLLPNGKPNGSPITQVGCYNQLTICEGGSLAGYREWWYTGTVTLNSTCNFWRFWVALCCRNNAIGNVVTPGSQNIFIETTFDNNTNLNSSPFVASPPIAYYCVNTPSYAYYTAIDPDGDSLVYESIAPQTNVTNCGTYAPTNIFSGVYNITEPFPTGNTFIVNPLTGVISFTPTVQGAWVFTVKIKEYRNGQYIGFIMRDIQFVVSICNLPPPLTVFGTYPSINCYGDTTTITAIGNGGIQPYQFNINGGAYQASNQFNGMGAGVYTITVMDANNCTATSVFTINQPPPFLATVTNIINPACNNPCSGTAQTNIAGGVSPYTYAINNPALINAVNGNINGLCTGNYTVTVTDDNGCTATSTVNVAGTTISLSFTNTTNVSCNAMCDASSQANATGGINPVTYSITPPGNINAATGTMNNLCAGTYTVSAADANSCSTTAVLTITQPQVLTISVTDIVPESCNGSCNGTSLSVASGGTLPYNYTISAPGIANNATGVNSSLCAGTYTVSVTDANGCTASTTFILNSVPPIGITINNITNVTCFAACDGQSVSIGSGGTLPYSYSINTPGICNPVNGNNSQLCAGTYTATITDANGCSNSTTFSITEPPVLNLSLVNSTDVTCNGLCDGAAQLAASGGTAPYVFAVNGGAVINAANGSMTNVCAGMYTVSAVDANGCSTSTALQINEPAALVWSNTVSQNVTCNGLNDGSISVTANGGTNPLSYTIQPLNQNNVTGQFTNLNPGTYTVTAADANGCSISTLITITQPLILQITGIGITNPTCVPGNDATLTINAIGGTLSYTYNIGFGVQAGNAFTNLSAGTYTAIVSDANGCTVSSIAVIVTPTSPVISNISGSNVSCNGGSDGSITVSATGGLGTLNYNLLPLNQNNATGIFTNLNANTYTIVVTDANGCTVSTTYTITQPVAISWSNINVQNVLCNGDTNGTINTGAVGGTGILTYTLQPGNVVNGTGLFNNLAPGAYTVTATDANGCSLSIFLQITQPNVLTWISNVANNVSCYNGTNGAINVTAGGGVGALNYNLLPNNITNATGQFTNLTAATYTISATDANNCTLTTIMIITQPVVLSLTNIAATLPTCIPGNDGSITVTAIGGTAAYLFDIGGVAQVNNNFVNVGAGNYTVTVTDANGCTASSTIVITNPVSPTIAGLALDSVTCYNGNDGAAIISGTGGLGLLNYQLLPVNINNNTGIFNNLNAGSYTVTVGDANGCTISSVFSILQPSALNWSFNNITNILCNGGNTGGINIGANGGTGILNYNLMPINLTNNNGVFPNLTAGIYTMTATDANNCTLSTAINIIQPLPLAWNNVSNTNVNCNAGADADISASTTGGTGNITYTLMPNNINNLTGQFSNLNAGTYTITAVDINGCSISTVVNIIQPTTLQISAVAATIPTCVPGNDATITITTSGGTAPYNYSLGGPGQVNNVFTNLNIGTYTIVVTDANGCSVTSIATIAAPLPPVITNVTTTDANCVPGNNGTITITAIGGNGIYTYSADGFNFILNNTIMALNAGTYTITVKDAFGCTATSTGIINTTPSPVITSIITTDASCVPGCDGTAAITATGGNAVYTYNANNINQPSNIFSAICAGIYTATVTDGNGCTASSAFTISTAPLPSIAVNNITDVLCFGGNNGALSVTATGIGAINYLLQPNGINNANGLFANLTAFNYTVIATDANGCSVTSGITVSEPPLLQFTVSNITNVSCYAANNGMVNLTVTGGTGNITLASNPVANFVPPFTFDNLIGNTTYTVTATDANGCTATSSFYVSEPQPLIFTSVNTTDVSCFNGADGSISAQAIGGTGILNYSIDPNPQNNQVGTFSNLAANVYTMTVTDANNCTLTSLVTINAPTQITISNLSFTNITCNNANDGTINVAANGGTGVLTYNLFPVNLTNLTGVFSGLAANTYTINIVDANGCSIDTGATILNPLPVTINSVVTSNVLCNGDSNGNITITASGGTGVLNYNLLPNNINNNNGQFNLLPANNYTVTITDANSCAVSTVIIISEPQVLVANLITWQNILCSGANTGQIVVGANGGTSPYNFNLQPVNASNAIGIFNNLNAGVYTVNVTDSNQCIAVIQPITLTEPQPIKFEPSVVTNIICHGDSSGKVVTVASGGVGTLQFSIAPNIGQQTPIGTFINLIAGTYTITAIDANNCTQTTVATVTENTEIIITKADYVSPRCWGETNGIIQVSASGGVGTLTYMINNQNPNTNGFFGQMGGGNYVITITDSLGCSKDTSIILTQPERIRLGALDISAVYCKGYSDGKLTATAIGGNGGFVYYLRPGLNSNTTGKFVDLHEGIYTLTVKDSLGCQFDTTIAIAPPSDALNVVVTKQDLSCYGKGTEGWAMANLTGGTAPFTYIWSSEPPQYDAKAIDLRHGKYIIEVTDANGCKDKDSVIINPGPCCEEVFLPNAFSPNGDGNNDFFRVTTSTGLELIQFEVYDRWGKKIWFTNDITEGWDGNDHKTPCDMNTFFYIMRYRCLYDGETYIKKGDINLIR